MDDIPAPVPNRRTGLFVEIRDCILQKYGERGRKALRAIDEGRVKKYRDFYAEQQYQSVQYKTQKLKFY